MNAWTSYELWVKLELLLQSAVMINEVNLKCHIIRGRRYWLHNCCLDVINLTHVSLKHDAVNIWRPRHIDSTQSRNVTQAGRRCGSLVADNRQLELNMKLIRRPVPKISSFLTFPRWQPVAVLDFVQLEVAPFDLPSLKTLESNIKPIGQPVPEILSSEIVDMSDFMTSLLMSYGLDPLSVRIT